MIWLSNEHKTLLTEICSQYERYKNGSKRDYLTFKELDELDQDRLIAQFMPDYFSDAISEDEFDRDKLSAAIQKVLLRHEDSVSDLIITIRKELIVSLKDIISKHLEEFSSDYFGESSHSDDEQYEIWRLNRCEQTRLGTW